MLGFFCELNLFRRCFLGGLFFFFFAGAFPMCSFSHFLCICVFWFAAWHIGKRNTLAKKESYHGYVNFRPFAGGVQAGGQVGAGWIFESIWFT